VLVIAGPMMFVRLQNVARFSTAYERALEMVPVLIHLPPISEDTETNGRDLRDIVDEISQSTGYLQHYCQYTQKNSNYGMASGTLALKLSY